MVGVDNEVQSHQVNEVLVLTKAELVCQVETIILILLHRSNLSIFEDVTIDLGSNGRELGNEVHGVLESVTPVLLLADTLGVGLCKLGLVLKSSDGERELSHWVESTRATVNELLNELRNGRTGCPFCREFADLLLGRDLASQKEPEET